MRTVTPHHSAPNVPRPTTAPGTLLYCVQLARFNARNRHGNCGKNVRSWRQLALDYASSHGGVLMARRVSEHQQEYVRHADEPWEVIVMWIETAIREQRVLGPWGATEEGE